MSERQPPGRHAALAAAALAAVPPSGLRAPSVQPSRALVGRVAALAARRHLPHHTTAVRTIRGGGGGDSDCDWGNRNVGKNENSNSISSHEFLHEVLEAFGIPACFRNMIKAMYGAGAAGPTRRATPHAPHTDHRHRRERELRKLEKDVREFSFF